MIPNATLNADVEFQEQPTKNYKMNVANDVINGYTDNLQAMNQVVFKILNTERFQHIIYSWNYGIELEDLLGEPISYVCPELERRIAEALVQDDRIVSVDSFSFEVSKGNVNASFVVHTIFGDLEAERAVNI
ncbi:MAG: DUF2634 domain-containing protein [Oscillospiraceae bacterium]